MTNGDWIRTLDDAEVYKVEKKKRVIFEWARKE